MDDDDYERDRTFVEWIVFGVLFVLVIVFNVAYGIYRWKELTGG